MDAGEFILRLNAQVTGAAGFNGALSTMEAQIKREQASLGGLEEKLASARKKLDFIQQGGSTGKKVDLFSLDKQKDVIASLEKKIAGKQESLGGLFKEGAKEADKLIGKKAALKDILGGELGNLASAASGAGGPIGALSDKLQSFASIAGKGGVAGVILILVASIFALAAAAVVAAVAITRFAFEMADAARSAKLLNDAAAGSAAGGRELTMVVNDIASRVPLAKEKIAEFGRALEVAHVSGRRMQVALEAISTLESVIPGAGAVVKGLAEEWSKLGARAVLTRTQLEGTGVSIDEVATALADKIGGSVQSAKAALASGRVAVNTALEAINNAVQRKFGKTLEAQMLSLSTQFSKFKENIAGLFADVDLTKFLEGLKTITDLFSQNSVVGAGLKQLFGTMFTGIGDTLAKAAPYIRAFLLGIAIVALQAYVGFLMIKKAITEAFGGATKSKILTVENALLAGKIAAVLIGGAFIAAALAAGLLTVAVISLGLVVAAPFILAVGVIGLVIYALYSLYNVIKSIDLGPSASKLVDTFVNAVKAKIPDVSSIMFDLGKAAGDALNKALEIGSPSRVAKRAALNVTTTFSDTVEDGTGGTRAAFSGMVDAGSAGAQKSAAPSGHNLEFNNCTFGGSLTEGELRAWMMRFLDGLSGEGPAPEPA